jgi:tetraacyldisaccharide 4'-kinase
MSAKSWLNEIWYERAAPPKWLVPLAGLFGAVTAVRRWLYAKKLRRAVRLSRPVIVVGNVSVGGTGKTPLVCWLVERLTEAGYVPGIVTRGYGGSSRVPRLVGGADDASRVGDEPLLMARRTGARVAVGRERPAAAQLLIDAGCNVIVSDDGLQHYALCRDVEILVIDGERGFGNGRLLPAGPLRERRGRAATVDAVVVNGGAGAGAGAVAGFGAAAGAEARARGRVYGMHLRGSRAVSLGGAGSRDLREFSGQEVHAVAGIGNPQRFFTLLRAFGLQVIAHAWPDHAVFKPADIEFGDGRAVLMTEKDAVKCCAFAQSQHWYVPVSVDFEGDGGAGFLEVVTRALARLPAATPTEGNHG